MLAMHYLLLVIKIWFILFTIFKLEKPRYFLMANGTIIIVLIGTDIVRYLTYGYHPLLVADVIIEFMIVLASIMLLTKKVKIFYVVVNIFIFNSLISSLISGFILTLFDVNMNVLTENVWFSLLGNSLGLIVVMILSIIAKKQKIIFELNNIKFNTSFLVAVMLFSYGFYLTMFLRLGNTYGQIINLIAASAGFLSLFVMFGFIINKNRISFMTAEAELAAEISRLQQFYYEQILLKDEETRKYRHDNKNHLLSLSFLVKDDSEKAKEYLDNLILDLDEIDNILNRSTGSPIVDAALNYARYKYMNYGVKLEMEVKITNNFGLSDYDATALFSNLINNAFEAAVKVIDLRYVKIITRELEDYWFFSIKNSVEVSSEIDLSMSSKEDKTNHGFGINKVIDIEKKYGLHIDFLAEQNEFAVEIMFPKKK